MATPRVFQSERRGDLCIVTPLCNIGSLIDEPIERDLEALIDLIGDPSVKYVVIDFQKCPFVGSSMLGAIIKLWRLIRDRGRLAVCNASEAERDVLRVANLDAVWPVCNTLADALLTVREPAP